MSSAISRLIAIIHYFCRISLYFPLIFLNNFKFHYTIYFLLIQMISDEKLQEIISDIEREQEEAKKSNMETSGEA